MGGEDAFAEKSGDFQLHVADAVRGSDVNR
jgi:hypothetical protein